MYSTVEVVRYCGTARTCRLGGKPYKSRGYIGNISVLSQTKEATCLSPRYSLAVVTLSYNMILLSALRLGPSGVIQPQHQGSRDFLPWPSGMRDTRHAATSLDGSVIDVQRFVPTVVPGQNVGRQHRAVVFCSCGGFLGGSVDVFHSFITTSSELSGTQAFAS